MDQLLRVDLSGQKVSFEPVPPAYALLGGRGLTSHIVLDEVPATCDPLGPLNKLVFAPGLLGGTPASSAGRVSVGAKSPLTKGIKESNAGGLTGTRLGQMGIKALILEGQPGPGDGPFTLVIQVDHGAVNAHLEAAAELAGLTTSLTAAKLAGRFGAKASFVINGPAGEMLLTGAGIAHCDPDGRPSRYSARGGLGAVMGSKRLKAIAFLTDGLRYRPAQAQEAWQSALREYTEKIQTTPAIERFVNLGTAAMLEGINAAGALTVRNFTAGKFDRADQVSGKRMREIILERGGEGTPTHACMPGCLIRCSNIFPTADGKFRASPMEYETNALMGPNLDIADFDTIAEITWLCDDLGLDTMELGCALGVAMGAGRLQFGDGPGVIRAVQEIGAGTDFGRMLGMGTAAVGYGLGVARIPVVKNQGIPAYDPRGMKGNGVLYATSPQGADQTAGNAIGSQIDHLSPVGQVKLSRDLQIKNTTLDCLGFCIFTKAVSLSNMPLVARLVNSLWGTSLTVDDLLQMGQHTIAVEREFNRRCGMAASDDRLPTFFLTEKLPPHQTVWDVPDDELDSMWQG